jgi:Phage tail protein
VANTVFRYAGVDLASLGVSTMQSDGLKGAPPVRGKNLLIPYSDGQRRTRKYYDERTIVLQGYISAVSATALDIAFDALLGLFPIASGEQLLEVQQANGTFRYVMAEVRNHLIPMAAATGAKAAKWSIELVASDPIWCGSDLENALGRGAWTLDAGIYLDDGAHWLDSSAAFFATTLTGQVTKLEASNGGGYFARRPIFTLVGPFNGLTITNLRNGYSLKLNGAGTRATIDCGLGAVNTDAANPIPTLGAGQMDWMHLEAGENTLRVDLGVYSMPVTYQAQYSPAFF